MTSMTTTTKAAVLACTAAGLLSVGPRLHAQSSTRGAVAAALFDGLDGNKDGALSREEARASADRWFTEWKPADAAGLSSESAIFGLSRVLPASAQCGGRSANPRTPCPGDVDAMVAALPASAPARPARPRQVLVTRLHHGHLSASGQRWTPGKTCFTIAAREQSVWSRETIWTRHTSSPGSPPSW